MATDVLIVEDESIVALDLEHRLTSMGFHVVGRVGTGAAALEIVDVTPPDVVLMDIQLRGDLDGITTADRIEESYDIPVIFLTAFSDAESLQRVKRVNAYGYLLKPFQERELSIAVELALYKHRAERELRENRALLDITLNNISEAIVTTDRSDEILFINRAAERLTGWTAAEAIGTDLGAVVRLDEETDASSSSEQWRRLSPRTGRSPRTVAVSRRELDRPSSGGAAHVIVIRDVTQEQEYREKLIAAKEAAESAAQAKSDFLMRVTHELRTPLNSILGMAGLLKGGADAHATAEYLDILDVSSQQLSGLISDILDYARFDTGRLVLQNEQVDPVRLVERVSRSFAVEAGKKGVRIITVVDPAVPRSIYSDGMRVGQLLRNLISNAVKFTSAGYVEISVSRGEAENCIFRVTDSGSGIPEEHRDLIFQEFSQVESPATRTVGGVGLGLALVRRLVTALNGTVELEHSSEHGSTFTVDIPCTFAEDEGGALPDEAPAVQSVATDDPLIARCWEPWCQAAGVQLSRVPWEEIRSDPAAYDRIVTGVDRAQELPDYETVVVVRGFPAPDARSPSEQRPNTVILEPATTDAILATLYHVGSPIGADASDDRAAPSVAESLAVLVVDDDRSNLVFQQKLLEAYGHRVVTAAGGDAALSSLRSEPFDAAILDIEMPEMDGWELAGKIRSGVAGDACRDVPLVALTGHDAREIASRAKGVGFNDVLTKPVQVQKVLQVLHNIAGDSSGGAAAGSVPTGEIREAIRAGDTDRVEQIVADLRQQPLPTGAAEIVFRLLLALRRRDGDAISRLTIELEKETEL
ncbi:MAG: response regulator [Alkalispirochaeta sp.]